MNRAWLVPLALSLVLAVRSVVEWVAVTLSGLPIAYGEGAVVHAGQLLARGADPYAPVQQGFVSANYPPLAYMFVALGSAAGPFVGLRVANLIASCAVAATVAWSARADRAVAIALGASFLALYPVALWIAADRVDLLAVAITLGAVVALRAGRGALFGALGGLAILAKPTAGLPLAVVLAYVIWREGRWALRPIGALAAVSLVAAVVLVLRFDARGLYTHLVVYNALPYDIRNPTLLVALGVLLLGAFIALALLHADGLMRAYLIGAVGVVLLAGHEGATINYLLDLVAASCLALARVARAPNRSVPPLIAGQLLATLVLSTVGPFALPSGGTRAAQVALLADMPKVGPYYAEDSGVLIAAGIEPLVDDVYVWARLVALGVRPDDVTPLVERRAFRAIVSEGPLDALAEGPEFRRQRWPERLVDAVLREYTLDGSAPGAYRYVPRR